jgi:hypothetical protein
MTNVVDQEFSYMSNISGLYDSSQLAKMKVRLVLPV